MVLVRATIWSQVFIFNSAFSLNLGSAVSDVIWGGLGGRKLVCRGSNRSPFRSGSWAENKPKNCAFSRTCCWRLFASKWGVPCSSHLHFILRWNLASPAVFVSVKRRYGGNKQRKYNGSFEVSEEVSHRTTKNLYLPPVPDINYRAALWQLSWFLHTWMFSFGLRNGPLLYAFRTHLHTNFLSQNLERLVAICNANLTYMKWLVRLSAFFHMSCTFCRKEL